MREDAEGVRRPRPAAAFLQDAHDFFGRFFGIAFTYRVRVNLADVRRRREPLHHGLVRREYDVVLVLPEVAGTLRLQDADDLERDALVADRLSDGVDVGEEVCDDRLPDDADFGHAVGIVVEHHAVCDFVIADLEVVGRYAGKRRGGVVVADNRLPAHRH